jgi:hypothetical protein
LSKLTGKLPTNAQAHHIFPQQAELAKYFKNKGIDINDPKFGAWWGDGHQKYAKEYNRKWQEWIDTNSKASRQDVLEQGREMAKEYNLQINF